MWCWNATIMACIMCSLVLGRRQRPLTPISVCSLMAFHSSTSSTPILFKTLVGTCVLPMSCSRAAIPSRPSQLRPSPSLWPIAREKTHTLTLCVKVYSSWSLMVARASTDVSSSSIASAAAWTARLAFLRFTTP